MTKKVFYYYEMEKPNDVGNPEQTFGEFLREKLDEHIDATNLKESMIIREFIFANISWFYKEANTMAAVLEFISDRDWNKHATCIAPFRNWLEEKYNVRVTHEVSRDLDYDGMQEPGPDDAPNSYWNTKVYFNETLPAERGFDTVCPLEESDGTMTWIEFWTREK